MKRKEIKDVIKKFTYKNKKSLCIFMVLAVLAGGIVIVKINSYKSQQTIDSENYARTVFVEKGEINRSINVNGKIESAEVSMVSTSLTEKVKSVNVKVGDYVKAGDVICTLDDGDITKEIEKKKSEIAENKKELEANYNKLSNQLKEAKNVKVSSVSAQDNVVSNLKSNYENTENDLNNYDGTYKKIQNTYNTMLSAIESKVNNYNEAENIKNSAYNAWIASGGNASSNEYVAYKSAEENLNNKQRELEEAKQLYNYEEIKESYNAALAIFNEKISNRNLAKEQYEAAVANRLSVINSADGEISNLESSVNDAYKQLQKADDNEELKNSLNGQFNGETAEVGLYLAMARVAQRSGYPEIAEVLKVIAWEEAEHAAQYAELTGRVSDCTKTNLTNMMNGEIGANKLKAELAQKAKDAGLEELYTFIDHAARDEARHASMLHGMLNRL